MNVKLIINEIIRTHTASYWDEAEQIYGYLDQAMSTQKPFELSFQGLETCSTRFLNASIGRLYRTFPKHQIETQLKITGIEVDDRVLPEMIRRAIDKALNPELYSVLREQTLANA